MSEWMNECDLLFPIYVNVGIKIQTGTFLKRNKFLDLYDLQKLSHVY